jgi:hypothetical protein
MLSPGMPQDGPSIAERSQKWQQNKEKKQLNAMKQKQMKELSDDNLTFKPNINKPKPRIGAGATAPNSRGMAKYMEKVERANKMKQDKKTLEEKVFGNGKNWTP